jgi:hypothetical protein
LLFRVASQLIRKSDDLHGHEPCPRPARPSTRKLHILYKQENKISQQVIPRRDRLVLTIDGQRPVHRTRRAARDLPNACHKPCDACRNPRYAMSEPALRDVRTRVTRCQNPRYAMSGPPLRDVRVPVRDVRHPVTRCPGACARCQAPRDAMSGHLCAR